jgi:hypothetical protein
MKFISKGTYALHTNDRYGSRLCRKKRVRLPACGAESNGDAGKTAGPGLQPPSQHLGAAVQVVVTFNKEKA